MINKIIFYLIITIITLGLICPYLISQNNDISVILGIIILIIWLILTIKISINYNKKQKEKKKE